MKVWLIITHDLEDTRQPDIVTAWASYDLAYGGLDKDEGLTQTAPHEWRNDYSIVVIEELQVQS